MEGDYTQNRQFASMCTTTTPTIRAAVRVVTATDVAGAVGEWEREAEGFECNGDLSPTVG